MKISISRNFLFSSLVLVGSFFPDVGLAQSEKLPTVEEVNERYLKAIGLNNASNDTYLSKKITSISSSSGDSYETNGKRIEVINYSDETMV